MKRPWALLLLLPLLAASDCPNQRNSDRFQLGKAFDAERMTGRITDKQIEYVDEMNDASVRGKRSSYCLVVQSVNSSTSFTWFCDLPVDLWDAYQVNEYLPSLPFLPGKRLAELQGQVIDRKAVPEVKMFFIVVAQASEIKVYRVGIDDFYFRLPIGATLPLSPGP